MRTVRFLAVLMSALVALVWSVGPATAHSSILSTKPAADSVLESAPAKVTVTFDSPLMQMGSAMVVRRDDGRVVSAANPVINGNKIAVDADPNAGAGTYTVAFRIVSEDGHSVTSNYTYTVTGQRASDVPQSATASSAPSAGAVTSAPAVTSSDAPAAESQGGSSESGSPMGAIVMGVVAIAVLGGAVVAWLVVRRRTSSSQHPD